MKIEELMEKACSRLCLTTNYHTVQEVMEARRLVDEHYENNFPKLLEALRRCKDVFVNDDWEGPLKNQIIKAIEDASNVEVTR